VPVTDARLAVPPAEVHHPALTPVRKVHQPHLDVLGDAAEGLDGLQPVLHQRRAPLESFAGRSPGGPVDDAATGHRDALVLGLQPGPRLAALGVCRHDARHDLGQPGNE
jgi:hypothetical protein